MTVLEKEYTELAKMYEALADLQNKNHNPKKALEHQQMAEEMLMKAEEKR